MEQPLVSIITPCYNGEAYLDRYFSSVLKQTYANLELIFVNDGSADRTADIVNRFRPRLEQRGIRFVYLTQHNGGQAAALNRGLKLFTGKYLTWPDADDEMAPDCIRKKVEYMELNPRVSLCICKGRSVTDDARQKFVGTLERIRPEKETLFEDLMWIRNVFFVPGGYMVRRSALDAAIPGREIYSGRGGQNAQILLPVCYGGDVGYLNECLFTYYIRPDSHSHQITDAVRTVEQLRRYETILLETLKRMGSEVFQRYYRQVQSHYARWEFGNAIDSQDAALIRECYQNLCRHGKPTWEDRLRYLRHTNRIFR